MGKCEAGGVVVEVLGLTGGEVCVWVGGWVGRAGRGWGRGAVAVGARVVSQGEGAGEEGGGWVGGRVA